MKYTSLIFLLGVNLILIFQLCENCQQFSFFSISKKVVPVFILFHTIKNKMFMDHITHKSTLFKNSEHFCQQPDHNQKLFQNKIHSKFKKLIFIVKTNRDNGECEGNQKGFLGFGLLS